MYTSPNVTREKALAASAAASRAMKRVVCCKSQFKFKCFSCGEMVQRGDKITMVQGGEGMTLRFRGSDSLSGLKQGETAFYQPSTGTKRWVHIGCNPCHWHSGGDGYGEPRLYGVWTDWGAKIESEFAEDYSLTGRWDMEEFLERNGYPQEKYMSDRVKAGVTAFQALWRGYIYKKAYPIARHQARATEAINLNARATLSTQSRPPHNHYARIKANIERNDAEGEAMFYCHNKSRVGTNSAILFDRGKTSEAIYSCEIVQISGESNGVQVYVRYHYDQERRKYHWKKFERLEKECHSFMIEMGIQLIEFEGKIPTNSLSWTG